MPVFAVRGHDGQLGIVAARSKAHAVERLDEFANFEGCPMRELPELVALLDIGDDGEMRLSQLGEEADAVIRAFAYPLVEQALNRDTPVSKAPLRSHASGRSMDGDERRAPN